jgi:hypothetical protein
VNHAAIFGLHVKYAISESDVRVVAKKHDAMMTWLGPVLAAGRVSNTQGAIWVGRVRNIFRNI